MNRQFTYRLTEEQNIPVKGSLIRSSNTNDYINLVVDVGPVRLVDVPGRVQHYIEGEKEKVPAVLVTSVRYAKVNSNNRILLKGSRARRFNLVVSNNKIHELEKWHAVEEYSQYDNSKEIEEHLAAIKDVQLIYEPNEEA